MTISELKHRHPHHRAIIKSEPLKECPKCRGVGEYENFTMHAPTCCLCVCLDGHDALRRDVVSAFYRAAAKACTELRQSDALRRAAEFLKASYGSQTALAEGLKLL